jgi:hypothetical protein
MKLRVKEIAKYPKTHFDKRDIADMHPLKDGYFVMTEKDYYVVYSPSNSSNKESK